MPTREDLCKQLQVLRHRHRALIGDETDEDTFPIWVLLALATSSERDAAASICGGSYDGGNDAVYVDGINQSVWIVQGKLREVVNAHSEKPKDIRDFARLAERLFEGPDNSTEPDFWRDLAKNTRGAAQKFEHASDCVRNRGYSAHLVFASLWKFTSEVALGDGKRIVRRASSRATIDFLGWAKVSRLLSNYLRDIAPAVPELTIQLTEGDPQKYPMGNSQLQARSFSTTGDQVADLLKLGGEQVFARNIRMGLGDKVKVNRAILESVRTNSDEFWFLNNGLTIICSSAKAEDLTIKLLDAQVINGQQTTRALRTAQKKSEDQSIARRTRSTWAQHLRSLRVATRVIEIGDEDTDTSDATVRRIVEATNFQNAITVADLRANDQVQIELQRELGARGYKYERRRGKPGGDDQLPLAFLKRSVKPADLATAVVGALHESIPLRLGRSPLFDLEKPYYKEVFLEHDVDFLLMCHWLWRRVNSRCRGDADRQAAKYLVHYDFFQSTRSLLVPRRRHFVALSEVADLPLLEALNSGMDALLDVAVAAYLDTRDTRGVKPYHQDEGAWNKYVARWKRDARQRELFADAVEDLKAVV